MAALVDKIPKETSYDYLIYPEKRLSRDEQTKLENVIRSHIKGRPQIHRCIIFPDTEGIRFWVAMPTPAEVEKIKNLVGVCTFRAIYREREF
jgi:hypothetical protein